MAKATLKVTAETDDYFRRMRELESKHSRSMENIRRASGLATTFLKGALGGIVAGGVAGVVGSIGEVAKGIAQIGDDARRAGVDVEAFQEWKFVAEQNRIGIDAMTDGLKELNLRADEFISTGKGSGAEAFMRLGYGAEELQRKLKNPSELLLEIIGRLGQFDKAAQIRIADEVFGGTGGERFVELLDQGEAGIRRTIQEARDLGVVLDQDVIDKAADLDRRFNAIATSVGVTLKSAIVSAADSLAEFIDGFRDFQNQQTRTLDNRMTSLGAERLEAERQLMSIREMQRNQVPDASGGYTWKQELDLWEAQLKRIAEQEAKVLGVLGSRTSSMTVGNRTWQPPEPPEGGFGGSGSSRSAAANATEREAEALARLISELEEELRLVGATSTQKQIAETLRRANVDAASKEGQQIAALVTEIESETAALERNREAQEARTQSIDALFGIGEQALSSIVDGSMEAEEAVKRLAIQLALAAAQAALLGTGPLAGFIRGGSGGAILGNLTTINFRKDQP